jgi:hypothetical protein
MWLHMRYVLNAMYFCLRIHSKVLCYALSTWTSNAVTVVRYALIKSADNTTQPDSHVKQISQIVRQVSTDAVWTQCVCLAILHYVLQLVTLLLISLLLKPVNDVSLRISNSIRTINLFDAFLNFILWRSTCHMNVSLFLLVKGGY